MADLGSAHTWLYRWPTTLVLPQRPPKLVYLDLNHWVSLAKANSGHGDGDEFKDVLAACLDAVERGVAVFPICDTTYREVSKIGLHRQRRDLADVIERLSGYRVVTSRVAIAQQEVEALRLLAAWWPWATEALVNRPKARQATA